MRKKNLNLTPGFVFSVLITLILTTVLSGGLILFLRALGLIPIRGRPLIMLSMLLLSSTFLGSILSYLINKKSLKTINKILLAVNEIGKGNFDVEIKPQNDSHFLNEIIPNINIMAKELKNLEIMRKDFIQNFSHEFKTPIVSIQGFAKRLLTKNLTENEKREYLTIILEESARLSGLAENTLYMSKLESMERAAESKDFMLDEQIRQCVLLLEKQWLTKNIEIAIDIPQIPYCGSEEMLKQVWVNLLSNAIKFTGVGGKITIAASVCEDGVCVSIADSGIGMSDETIKRMFDKYYQGDPSRATQGNGLGLSIVSKILELAGGSISVKSVLGEGSEFLITLPA